jgi:hypothetical protein
MALTLRPTDLERSPATAHLEDWIVLDDGIIYQRHAPANADVAWFWSITTYVEPRWGLRTSGTTGTLDASKAAFPLGSSGSPGQPKPDLTQGPADRLLPPIAENRLAGHLPM